MTAVVGEQIRMIGGAGHGAETPDNICTGRKLNDERSSTGADVQDISGRLGGEISASPMSR